MHLKLVLCCSFESDFKNTHYYIYQFVEPRTLTIINYSSTKEEKIEIGTEYDCEIGISRGKYVIQKVTNL